MISQVKDLSSSQLQALVAAASAQAKSGTSPNIAGYQAFGPNLPPANLDVGGVTGPAAPVHAYSTTITSASATQGAIYSDGTNQFSVLNTVASSTNLLLSGNIAAPSGGTLTLVSGTGSASITFSASTVVSWTQANMNWFLTNMLNETVGAQG